MQAGVTYLFVQLCKVRGSGAPRVWPPGVPDLGDPAVLLSPSPAAPGATLDTTRRDCAPPIPEEGWKAAESLVQVFPSTCGKIGKPS